MTSSSRKKIPPLLGTSIIILVFVMILQRAHSQSPIPSRPTYVVISGKEVEPGVPFKVVVTLSKSNKRSEGMQLTPSANTGFDHFLNLPSSIQTKILRKGTVVAEETRECQFGTTEIIAIKVPDHLKADHKNTDYQLVVEGNEYARFHGSLFLHKKKLSLRRPKVDILLETDQPLYKQGQIVRIRAIPLGSDGRVWLEPIYIFLYNPRGDEMRRWPRRNAANGPIDVEFPLADPTLYGQWTVVASAARSTDRLQFTKKIRVVEYTPVGFEVEVGLTSDSVVSGDHGLVGTIKAASTVGSVPTKGLLKMKAHLMIEGKPECLKPLLFKSDRLQEHFENHLSVYNGEVESLKFSGQLKWVLPMREIEDYICDDGGESWVEAKVKVTAALTDHSNGEQVEGFAEARVTRKNLNMGFSVPSPSIFHHDMPFHTKIWIQRGNGEPLRRKQLRNGELMMEINAQWSDGRRDVVSPKFPVRRRSQFSGNRHLWKTTIPSMKHRLLSRRKAGVELASVTATATFSTLNGIVASADLQLLPQTNSTVFVPKLQLTTSTANPRVGENMIFHVRSNFDLKDFYLVIMSGQRLLTSKPVGMLYTKLKTFHEMVTSDMTPTATFIIWHIDSQGTFVHTSLTVQTTAKSNTTISAHSVMEGNSGYSQLSFTGNADTLVALGSAHRTHHSSIAKPFRQNLEIEKSSMSDMLHILTDAKEFQPAQDDKEDGSTIVATCQVNQGQECDRFCDCFDCSDEVKCSRWNDEDEQLQVTSSPTMDLLTPTGFWSVVKIGRNGTAKARVPFHGRHQQLLVTATAMGSRGLTHLPYQRLTVGAYVDIQLELPATCKIGEHISIKLTCVNVGGTTVRKSLRFAATLEQFFFLASDGSRTPDHKMKQVDVVVPANAGYKIIFIPIVPLKVGPLEVAARIGGSDDLLKARTLVQPEGLRMDVFEVMNIDMTLRPYFVGGIDLSRHNGLPGHAYSQLLVSGGVVPALGSLDVPINTSSVLDLPQVTADEAIFAIESTLQTIRQASQTGSILAFSTDQSMYLALTKSYQRLLSYQASDGSFSYYNNMERNSVPSTFLTSMAVSTLYKLHIHYKHPIVDGVVLQRSIQWLFKNQHDDGKFRESNVYDGNYQRLIPIEFQEVALTAHVIIAMSHFLDEDSIWNTSTALRLGANFLSDHLKSLDQSGTSLDIALVARALQVTKSTAASETAFEILAKKRRDGSQGTLYWGDMVDCDDALALRSTAYALMVYTERGEYMTEPIVRWINSRRKAGWGSTIDTVLAADALLMWDARFPEKTGGSDAGGGGQMALEVDFGYEYPRKFGAKRGKRELVVIKGDGSSRQHKLNLDKLSMLNAKGNAVQIEGRGSGMAVAQLKTTYYTTSNRLVKKKNSIGFDLEPRMEMGGLNNTTEFKVLSCQRWNCQTENTISGPTVLTIGIPSGFALSEENRQRLIEEDDKNVWITESDIVFFFHKLESDYQCINFTLRRIFPVAKMSPYIPVKIFDWYSPDRRNSTILFLPELNGVSICDVCGSYECPDCDHVSSPSTSVTGFDYSGGDSSAAAASIHHLYHHHRGCDSHIILLLLFIFSFTAFY